MYIIYICLLGKYNQYASVVFIYRVDPKYHIDSNSK